MSLTIDTAAAEVSAWLDLCEAEHVPPGRVQDQLTRAGWAPSAIAAATLQYRKRFNKHPLGYSGLLITTGLVALGAGSVGHVLPAGLAGPVDRNALAVWLTLVACALPFAIWSHRWARCVDRTDPVAQGRGRDGSWASRCCGPPASSASSASSPMARS